MLKKCTSADDPPAFVAAEQEVGADRTWEWCLHGEEAGGAVGSREFGQNPGHERSLHTHKLPDLNITSSHSETATAGLVPYKRKKTHEQ